MIDFGRSYALVIGIGVLAAAAWSFGFSKLHYVIYQAIDNSDNPTSLFWAAMLMQSFLMGAIPGIFVPFASKLASRRNVFVFLLAISIFVFATALVLGGLQALSGLVSSVGMWVFMAGAVVGSLGASYAKNAT